MAVRSARRRTPSAPVPARPSRAGIGGRGRPGAIRFPNHRAAKTMLHHLQVNAGLDKRDVRAIFQARGGSKRLFEQYWRRNLLLRRGEEQSYVHRGKTIVVPAKTNADLRRDARKALREYAGAWAVAKKGRKPETWLRLHAAGEKKYWGNYARYERFIAEYYPKAAAPETPLVA